MATTAPHTEAGEQTPLLAAEPRPISHHDTDTAGSDAASDASGDSTHAKTARLSALRVLVLTCILVVLLNFGKYLAVAPQTEIWMGIVCRQLQEREQLSLCPFETAQKEVALLTGWSKTLGQIPGILFALPYGVLGDRIGRRPVLALGTIGLTLSDVWIKLVTWFPDALPLRWVWAAPFFLVVGGGGQVILSMLFVMLADVYPEDERTKAFFYITAVKVGCEVLATPLSAVLMNSDPWIPFLLSTAVTPCGIVISLVMPETKDRSELRTPVADGPPPSAPRAEEVDATAGERSGWSRELRARISSAYSAFMESMSFMLRNPGILLLLLVCFAAYVGKQVMNLLLLFVSNKFRWSIAEASFLIPVRGIINFLVLVLFPPFMSFLARTFEPTRASHPSSSRPLSSLDLPVSIVSAALLCLGCVVVALSPSIPGVFAGVVIFALGSAIYISARNLATQLADAAHVSTLYTAIAAVQASGIVVAGPLLASAYGWGLEQGGVWLGAPFLLGAVLYGVAGAAVVLAALCVPKNKRLDT